MTIIVQWLHFWPYLAMWKKIFFCLLVPFFIVLFFYLCIFITYQQDIALQQTEITQRLIRINQYQKTQNAQPSLVLLQSQYADYAFHLEHQSPDMRLQHLFSTYQVIPQTWENEHNSLYKLTFILPYSQFLSLLAHLSHAGFSLTLLDVIPTKAHLLSIQIHLIDLNESISKQGALS